MLGTLAEAMAATMPTTTMISTSDIPSHAFIRRCARPAPTDPLGFRLEGSARAMSPINPRRPANGTEDRAEVWHMA
jgi:hypothetical protein